MDLPWLGQASGTFSDFPASHLLADTNYSHQAARPSWTLLFDPWLLPFGTSSLFPRISLLPNPSLPSNRLLYFASQSFIPFPLPGRFHLSLCSPILPFQELHLSSHKCSLHRQLVGCQWQTINLGQNTPTSNHTFKSRLHLAPCGICILILYFLPHMPFPTPGWRTTASLPLQFSAFRILLLASPTPRFTGLHFGSPFLPFACELALVCEPEPVPVLEVAESKGMVSSGLDYEILEGRIP